MNKDILTNEEEKQLFKEMKKGNEKARQILIEKNLRLVNWVIKKYIGQYSNDLFQEGCIGLIKAVDNFNLERKIRFSTYATTVIKRNILNAIKENAFLIRIPVHKQDEITRFKKVQEDLYYLLQREPTKNELAQHCNLSIKKTDEFLRIIKQQSTFSMEQMLDDVNLEELLPSNIDIEQQVIDKEALNLDCYHLTEKEKRYFIAWLGINDGIEKNLSEVANIYKTSYQNIQNSISRSKKKILKGIKKTL